MPEKLSVPEFAAQIKRKYPEYRDMDDLDLTQRILKKYPEWRDQVDLDERSFVDVAVPTALRVGGAIGGAALGGASSFGAGTLAGGAAGGALGELLAEAYEKARGIREGINPLQVGVQGALSAIPGSRAASLARRAATTAGLGATGVAATELAEGRVPELQDVALGATVGGALGAVARPRPRVQIQPQTSPSSLQPEDIIGKGRGTIFGDPTTPVPPQGKMSDAQKFGSDQPKRGIRLHSFPEPIRDDLQKVLEEHEGFEVQRRGVQSWERTAALAQRIAVDLRTSLPKGKVLRAEEQGAYSNALTSITEQLAEFAQRDPSSLSPEEILKFEKLRAEQLVTMKSLWGSVSETGRALNYWKSLKYVMESHDERFIREVARIAEGDLNKIREALKLQDPIARYEWLRNNQNVTAGDKVRAYVYGNMLSGIRTHERNFLGNTARLTFDLAADLAGDIARGRPKATVHKVLGIYSAIPRAAKEFAFQMKQGFSREAAIFGQFDQIQPELGGGGLNPWNDVIRLLQASDTFTKILIKNGELYRRAYVEALKEGHRGPALAARAAELRATPPAQWLEEATKVAVNTVFQDPLGKVSGSIASLINTVPGGWLIVPFIKIASNITKAGAEASPLGFFMGAAREGGRIGELARARAAVGSALTIPFAVMASQGLISGSGPSDPAKRALLMQTGWRPNSIRIGDQWIDYTTWQPVSVPMMAIANFFEKLQETEGQIEEKRLDELVLGLMFKLTDSILNQSFLQGLNTFFETLSNPEGLNLQRFQTGVVQQFTPFSGLGRNIAQTLDPVIRTPEGPVEAMQAVIPGMTEGIQPLLDPYGRPTIRRGTPPLLSGLVGTSPVIDDPVAELLLSLDVPLARPRKDLREGPDLSPEERTALGMARGLTRTKNIERLVSSPYFRRRDSEDQIAALRKAKERDSEMVSKRAKRLKKRGEKLSPERLVSRQLIDDLYQEYLTLGR